MKKLIRRLRKLPRPSVNMSMTVAAVVISLCALVVSFAEVRIMRSQQRANLYPYLKIGQKFTSEGYGLMLTNKGIGPARVNSFQVYTGDLYFTDWVSVAQHFLPDSLKENMGWHNMQMSDIQDEIIAPNESIRLIWTKYTPTSRRLLDHLHEIELRLCYSSLLDEHWVVQGDEAPKTSAVPCKREEAKEKPARLIEIA